MGAPTCKPTPPQRHFREPGKNLFDLPDLLSPCELRAKGRKKMCVLLSVTCSTFYLSAVRVHVHARVCVCACIDSQRFAFTGGLQNASPALLSSLALF